MQQNIKHLSFKTILLVGKYMNTTALEHMQDDLVDLADHLRANNYQVMLEENSALDVRLGTYKTLNLEKITSKIDLVVVMGGDGTMLSMARSLAPVGVPMVGVNRGRFGFLTDLVAEDMPANLDAILGGDYIPESRLLLSADLMRNGEAIMSDIAMNDVVIKSNERLIDLEVKIDQMLVYQQRSDGLIVSTPTGTTAYALSAGGPILHPNLHAITLVPICPHTLSNRPITVHSSSLIEITIKQINGGQLALDGQSFVDLSLGDKVVLKRAPQAVTLLHPANYCYFDMLRTKLNWG